MTTATLQPSYKIYSYPREMIKSIMLNFGINHEFSPKELLWKTKDVQLKHVTFEVHEKIVALLRQEIALHEEAHEETIFTKKHESFWEVLVRDNGSESYYFARMLFIALARAQSGIVEIENLNCKIVELYAISAAIKAGISTLGFVVKTSFEEGCYKLYIPINGMTVTFQNDNVDQLCKAIGQQLRGILKSSPD